MTILFDPVRHDVAALAALHAGAFPQPWSVSALTQLLTGPGVFAFHQSEGFILARVAADEAEILTLAVTPAARGRGHGRALLEAAAAHAAGLGAQSLFLEVGQDNPAALALYAGRGFVRAGQRKGYYDGKDAWLLRASLPLSRGGKFA